MDLIRHDINEGPLAFDRIDPQERFKELLISLEHIERAGLLSRFRITYGNIRLVREHADGVRVSVTANAELT